MYNVLITGFPRVGKTTLINNVIEKIQKSCDGIITKEIRKDGKRKGFKIETLSGLEAILASKDNISSRYRVSTYGVYLENIDKIVKSLEITIQRSEPEIIIIDEIGKMELFSNSFKVFLEKCLDKNKVLGTIMLKDNTYANKIKNRTDTVVYQLKRENTSEIEEKILERFR